MIRIEQSVETLTAPRQRQLEACGQRACNRIESPKRYLVRMAELHARDGRA